MHLSQPLKTTLTRPPEHFSVDEARDRVELESMDSFPCSDPPSFSGSCACNVKADEIKTDLQ